MKKLLKNISILILAAVVTTGCADFLDTESKSEYTSDVVFSTVTYTDYAVVGVYTAMIYPEVWVNFYYQNNTDTEIQEFSPSSYDDNERRSIGNYVASSGNIGLEQAWTYYYKAIERANLCIEGIRTSPLMTSGTDTEKAMMRMYLGESLTLRAHLYTELVRNWGDVPFKTEPTDPKGSNFFLPKTDRDKIYEQLIIDLQEAEDMVPWLNEYSYSSNPERITKGYIKGLMARICLYRGGYSFRMSNTMERGSDWQTYYDLARTQCSEIIEKGIHRLNPSFISVWKNLCQLKFDRDYNENLFEMGFTMGYSGEQGYIAGWRYDKSDKYGYGNMGAIRTTPAFLYSYDPADSRRLASVAIAKYDATPKQAVLTDPAAINVGKWNKKWMTDEYINLMKGASGKIVTGVNWVPMRMSDVYLMLAETENALQGDMGAARNALKTVRGRAFNDADDATKLAMVENYVNALAPGDDFFNAIVDERAWEFVGESVRKWDLIRWNLLTTKIQQARSENMQLVQRQGKYSYIPPYLFVRYDDSDKEDIDYKTLNLDQDRGMADIEGYTRVAWYPTTCTDPLVLASYKTYLDALGCGLDGGNGFYTKQYVPNRHLMPISQKVVDDAAGAFKNDYGF